MCTLLLICILQARLALCQNSCTTTEKLLLNQKRIQFWNCKLLFRYVKYTSRYSPFFTVIAVEIKRTTFTKDVELVKKVQLVYTNGLITKRDDELTQPCDVQCREKYGTLKTLITMTFTCVMQFYGRDRQFLVCKRKFNPVFTPTVLKGSMRVARVDTSVMKLCGRQTTISVKLVHMVCICEIN